MVASLHSTLGECAENVRGNCKDSELDLAKTQAGSVVAVWTLASDVLGNPLRAALSPVASLGNP